MILVDGRLLDSILKDTLILNDGLQVCVVAGLNVLDSEEFFLIRYRLCTLLPVFNTFIYFDSVLKIITINDSLVQCSLLLDLLRLLVLELFGHVYLFLVDGFYL